MRAFQPAWARKRSRKGHNAMTPLYERWLHASQEAADKLSAFEEARRGLTSAMEELLAVKREYAEWRWGDCVRSYVGRDDEEHLNKIVALGIDDALENVRDIDIPDVSNVINEAKRMELPLNAGRGTVRRADDLREHDENTAQR